MKPFGTRTAPHLPASRWFVFCLVVVTLFLLGMLAESIRRAATRVTDENVFAGNTAQVKVIQVLPGGASDRAGMKVGDLIVAINGRRFQNALEADRILRSYRPGEKMRYDILRGKQAMTLTVQAARIGLPFQALEAILFALLMTGLGLFVALRVPHLPEARLFSLALIVSAQSLSGIIYAGPENLFTHFRILIIPLSIALVFHSGVALDPGHLSRRRLRIFLVFNYGVAALSFLALVVLVDFRLRLSLAWTNLLSMALLVLAPLLVALFLNRLTARVPKEKLRIRRIVQRSWGILILALVSNGLIAQTLPRLTNLAFLLVFTVPLAYFYLIFRHRLFGLGFVIRRSVLHSVFSAVLGGFWLYALISVLAQLNLLSLGDTGVRISRTGIEIGSKSAPGFSERPLIMAAGIAAFVSIYLLWRLSRRWLAGEFFKREYDYHHIITEMAAVIAAQLTVQELAKAVTRELPRLMKLKGVALLVRHGEGLVLGGVGGFSEEQQNRLATLDLAGMLAGVREPMAVCAACPFPQLGKAGIYFIHPLLLKGEIQGLFLLGEKQSEDNFRTNDITFIEALSRQVAVALENTRLTEIALQTERMTHDLELARRIQQHLLPARVPATPSLDIAGLYLPASEVGGDYYDFLIPGNSPSPSPPIHVILADVAGKGIAAALFVTRIQGIFRSAYQQGILSPRDLLIHANHLSYTDDRKSFITMVCCRFLPAERQAIICRAGHLPILFQPGDGGAPQRLAPGGIALGLSRNGVFADNLLELTLETHPGDVFVLFSDGVTEARNERQEEFELPRLEEVVHLHRERPAGEIAEAIRHSLARFVGSTPAHDDSTLVVVKIPEIAPD